MNMNYKYPPGIVRADAVYSNGHGHEMDSNPLIAALQPSWSTDQMAAALSWWPDYDPKMRHLDANERADRVVRLLYSFETLPSHLPIYRGILQAMRLGYIGRDRYVHAHTEQVRNRTKLMSGERIAPPPEGKGQTMLVHGLPGTGKTSTCARLQCLVPQVIDHTEFQGQPWPCRQVTFLRVVAQMGWSDRALAQAIVEEFDRVAGTNYAARTGTGSRPSSFNYLMQFNLAAHNHGLGVLILDEVQLLKNNTSLLNFVLNFSTLVGVPLVLVGTPASKDLMQQDPRFMRRAESWFDGELSRFSFPEMDSEQYEAMLRDPNGPRDAWTYFVEAFWHRQYTAAPAPLTYELSHLLWYLSAGLVEYALKMFVAAQLLRIGTERDVLDADAFRTAAQTCFSISLPYLEALRTGNNQVLRSFEDFAGVDADTLIRQAAAERLAKATQDDAARLDSVRKARSKRADKPLGPPNRKPDPVSPDQLPVVSAEEFLS